MSRTCTICTHPAKESINQALLNGEPHRVVASRYEASRSAVFRHKDHLPKPMLK
jgi:hypothetical protein